MRIPIVSAGALIISFGFMLALVFMYSVYGPPQHIYAVPKPTPSEQTTMTVLAECDRFGCVPAYGVMETPR